MEKGILNWLTFGLRTGDSDKVLINFIAAGFEPISRNLLLRYVKEHGRKIRRGRKLSENPEHHSVISESHESLHGVETPPESDELNDAIVDLLARLGLEKQLSAYLSRFPMPCPAKLALACERLQARIFDGDAASHLGEPPGVAPGRKLNLFRLAQKLRDEHGTRRRDSPLNCFCLFEDIIELERKIDSNDTMDFISGCLALQLIEYRHLRLLFRSASNFAQLEALNQAVIQLGGESLRRNLHYESSQPFRWHFEALAETQSPAWQHVKTYLRITRHSFPIPRWVFDTEVEETELDEALNCVLNSCVRRNAHRPGEIVQFLKVLLNRGASLFFRDPNEDRLSLYALVEFAFYSYVWSEFSPHFCCLRKYDGDWGKIKLAHFSSLVCLAARRIPQSGNDLRLPGKLRSFVEAHQQLQLWADD